MTPDISRRRFMQTAAGAAAAGAVAKGATAKPPAAEATLPMTRLGNVEVSRLILGSNPFWGFAHRTKQAAAAMKEYFTDQRIVECLEAAGEQGVTAVTSPPYERWIKLFAEYWRKGGKVRTWIAQPHAGGAGMVEEIKLSVKGGAAAVFCQGARVDEQFAKAKFDVVGDWVKLIHSLGVPAGMASHRADVHLAAEKQGFPTDFYFQCFYNVPTGYHWRDRDKAVAAARQIDKPVVGYKILASGRLRAEDGFAFAFGHLRSKDAVCVGMFPPHDPDMFKQNAGLVRKLAK